MPRLTTRVPGRPAPGLAFGTLEQASKGGTVTDTAGLNDRVKAAWNGNAAFWDERMAEGNAFQLDLVAPATERLLALEPGESVLEIACGNGVMARRLAHLGARVLATDFAESMIERARARGDGGGAIEYRVVDATSEAQLLALGDHVFEAVVCNMALMDMAEIDPLLGSVPALLKAGGRFVFTQTHPCFNSSGCDRVVEERDTGEIEVTHAVKVWRYRSGGATEGLAMRGQPHKQLYFNRTIEDLFGSIFGAGMVIDGLEEPTFDPDKTGATWIHWGLFAEMPPVLAVRARPR